VIDLLGDGSSLWVRPSHPYEEGIYVFVQANPRRKRERCIRNIENKPEVIADWIIELQQRFGSQGKVIILWSRVAVPSSTALFRSNVGSGEFG
jgi:hypothetical protein